MYHRIRQTALFLTGLLSLTIFGNLAQGQSTPPNLDRLSPREFENIQPVRQPNFLPNSGGSQQFFEGGGDRLYFLPAEKSEPILRIDKTVEAEGLNYEDLQPKPEDK